MHFSYWMILAAALLPYVTVSGAKAKMGYDNANPRGYLDRLAGGGPARITRIAIISGLSLSLPPRFSSLR